MKFISRSKNLSVWDAEKNKVLCRFRNGVYETDNESVIEKLLKIDEVSAVDAAVEQKPVEEPALDQEPEDQEYDELELGEMSVKQLRAYADQEGIELPARANKAELLAIVEASLEE